MTTTTDIEDLDMLREEKRRDAAHAGAGRLPSRIAGQDDPHADALHAAEIARLKDIIERARVAMETMRPGSATGGLTAAELAGMWNTTLEMLRAG